MTQNGMLKDNELQANKLSAKVMRITFLIFTLVFVLNIIGIFVVVKHKENIKRLLRGEEKKITSKKSNK